MLSVAYVHSCHGSVQDLAGAIQYRVLQPLQAAATGFAALEDFSKAAEAQHLIAVVCHAVSNTSRRNAAAGEFHRLTWQAQQTQGC